VEGVTVFMLAGGRSSRMGSDKACSRSAGSDITGARAANGSRGCGESVIVGPRERYAAFGEVIEDVYVGCGPLAGIHAALCASDTDLNLMLSVDMPLMTPELLSGSCKKRRRMRN
jgi:molybdenum cofactor guanylyltransferase